ncbi:MAG: hypothetical protein P1P89_15575 [Desulfobacterales bacterium]|nr:hypothetical protein [Desulfobacterales bacterium]
MELAILFIGCVNAPQELRVEALSYNQDGAPLYKIACCLLKEEIQNRHKKSRAILPAGGMTCF